MQLLLIYAMIDVMTDDWQLSESLRILADPDRRRVLELLSGGARRAGELAAAVGVPPATMSRHLKALLAAGIVDDERSVADARVRLFFLQREALVPGLEWLQNLVASGRRGSGQSPKAR